jgi:hypothetical protein
VVTLEADYAELEEHLCVFLGGQRPTSRGEE